MTLLIDCKGRGERHFHLLMGMAVRSIPMSRSWQAHIARVLDRLSAVLRQ